MRAGDTQCFHLACDISQDLGTLLNLETLLAQIGIDLRIFGNGWGAHHQRMARVDARLDERLHIVLVRNGHPLRLQIARELRRSMVVTENTIAARKKIACKGAHTDAPDAQKIKRLYIFRIHSFVALLPFELDLGRVLQIACKVTERK